MMFVLTSKYKEKVQCLLGFRCCSRNVTTHEGACYGQQHDQNESSQFCPTWT